jgi:hypothetical protein
MEIYNHTYVINNHPNIMYLSRQLLNAIGTLQTIIQYVSQGATLILLSVLLSFFMTGSANYALYLVDKNYDTITDVAIGFLDLFTDILLISMGGAILGLLTNYWVVAITSMFRNTEKRVIIVRGVPGIGKKSYAEWRELHKEQVGHYTICNWARIFEKWSDIGMRYEYDPLRVREADHRLMRTYIRSLSARIDRIYVVHTFEKMWQYNPYVELAGIHGYTVEIVELLCHTKRELRHFNKRSIHNVPMEKSLRVFLEWHGDKRAIVQHPYLEPEISVNGDSIPLHLETEEDRKKMEVQLDRELEAYKKNIGSVDEDYEVYRPIGKRQSSLDMICKLSAQDRWNVHNKYKYV